MRFRRQAVLAISLWLGLFELGLLLPFEHLGYRDNTGGAGTNRWVDFVC